MLGDLHWGDRHQAGSYRVGAELSSRDGVLGKMKKKEGALGSREAGLVFRDVSRSRQAPESHVSWGSRQSSRSAAKEIQE